MIERILGVCFVLAIAFGGDTARAAPPSPSNREGALPAPIHVALGQSVVPLNGPWRFRTGDDPRWAQPGFDDSSWEAVDLTPAPGARDSDVGLTGYVPGWQTRGHRGYAGYAWYRLRVSVTGPPGERLLLCGPLYVDLAYQIFANGELLGQMGEFSGRTPAAYSAHRPTIYPLPQPSPASSDNERSLVVAVRVWMAPFMVKQPDSGGIHIAPALGTPAGAEALHRAQWWQTIVGYIVDAVEGLLFVLLAVMALTLIPFDRSDTAYRWLAAALVLVGLARDNQAVFFWGNFESLHGFEWVTVVLLTPLSLAAWTLAWRRWLSLQDPWMPAAVGVLASIYMGLEFSRRTWFYGAFPHGFTVAVEWSLLLVRWLFLLLTLLIVFRAMAQPGREKWFTLAAILLVSIGLFARELSALHVPGIWFPFGVGVSRTQYVYAALDVVLFVLLWRRLYALGLKNGRAVRDA